MVIVLVLVLLAIVFGIGAVLEGIAWLFLIVVVLAVLAVWFGLRQVRGGSRR